MATPPKDAPVARFANIFVIVALVSMLVGAVLMITARETSVVDVPPGEEATVLAFTAPSWDPFSHTLSVVVHGPANVTLLENRPGEGVDDEAVLRIDLTSEDVPEGERENATLQAGGRATWSGTAQPGETWRATVENRKDVETGEGFSCADRPADCVRVAATVHHVSAYVVGGVFVGIGILGFVAHRLGLQRWG